MALDQDPEGGMSGPDEILFGGTLLPSTAPNFEFVRKRGAPWFLALEAAFDQITATEEGRARYGDLNKGASLRQAWNTNYLLTGRDAICLLAVGRPHSASAREIPTAVMMTPADLVQTLQTGCQVRSGKFSCQIFVHDAKVHHCVSVRGYDADSDSFRYHDGWPGRSLLCAENNASGVAARPVESDWTVTADELRRVMYAAFLSPGIWADLTNVSFRQAYDDFKGSDFWEFFNLTESKLSHEEQNGETFEVNTLLTGAFREFIDLSITVDPQSVIREGQLSLQRTFVMDEASGCNPLALDITRSFIMALSPVPDEEEVVPVIETLSQLGNPEFLRQLAAGNVNLMANTGRFAVPVTLKDDGEVGGDPPAPSLSDYESDSNILLVYLGAAEEAEFRMQFSNISFCNFESADGVAVLQVSMSLFDL